MLFLYTYFSLCRHTMTYIKTYIYAYNTHARLCTYKQTYMRVPLLHLLLYAVKLNSEDES